MADELKRTPLYDEHSMAGAKLVPFAGYEMPVQYPTGIIAEHQAVRTRAGLFDVSHMGELEIRGEDPLGFVQFVTTNDAAKLDVGQAHYTTICQEDGTVLDDCLVYRFADHYWLVVNAANTAKVRDWISKFADRFGVEVVDRTPEIALLALQGPAALDVLSRLMEIDPDRIPYYHFVEAVVVGRPAIVSRTGYTGEDGFELYIDTEHAVPLWRRILEVGDPEGVIPAGLGARDSLRLEMGYVLYGNDVDEQHTPLEAGLSWVVKLDKGEFIGRDALARQKEEGVRERLVGFILQDRAFPRHGYEVRHQGEPAGEVTSGTVSPMLNQGVGLAYIAREFAAPGTPIEVVIRNRPVPAEVVRPPFYKGGSIRK